MLLEHQLRDILARDVGGITEVTLPYGRADVATATTVFEVEGKENWRTGVRQVLAYAAQSEVSPALALFGAAAPSEVLDLYLQLRDGTPVIALWWFSHGRWREITARSQCFRMWNPDPKDMIPAES